MNKHAENIKNAVNDYKKATEAAKQKIDYITATYGPTAGEAETEIQAEKLEKARAAAEDTIIKAARSGYKEVEAWERMDGSKLTDDIRLMDAGLVDHGEFNRLKVKYRDNSTMLAALKQYGDKQNATAIKDGGLPAFETRDIPTAEGKRKQWENAQTQALDMLDMLDGTGKYENVEDDDFGTAFTLGIMEEQMKTFGENL